MSDDPIIDSIHDEEFVDIKKSKKGYIYMGVGFILVVLSYFTYMHFQKVEVLDFVSMTSSEVVDWAKDMGVVLEVVDEYNEDKTIGTVLSQEYPEGTIIKKKDSLRITVSRGPDPNKSITIPDFDDMSKSDIQYWISENKLTGVSFTYEYSDYYDVNTVMKVDYIDGTKDDFKRKNRVRITLSRGSRSESEQVVVPNFSNYTEYQIISWADENRVEVVIEEEYNENVAAGSVINQSVNANKEISRSATITIVISKGKEIIVPDFTAYDKTEVERWSLRSNVDIIYDTRYSDTVAKDGVISQTLSEGTSITQSDQVRVVVSLGKIDLYSFVGSSIIEFLNWVDEVNSEDANITYIINEVYSETVPNGIIISHTSEHNKLNRNETITIYVSKGKGFVVPDFEDKTLSQVLAMANMDDADPSNDMNIAFVYGSYPGVNENIVANQSIDAGTVVSDAETITIYISVG